MFILGRVLCKVNFTNNEQTEIVELDFDPDVTLSDLEELIEDFFGFKFETFEVRKVIGPRSLKQTTTCHHLTTGNYIVNCVQGGRLIICLQYQSLILIVYLVKRIQELVSTTGTDVIKDIPSDTISEVLFAITTIHIPDSEFNKFGVLGLFKGGVVGYFHSALFDVLKHGEIKRVTSHKIEIKAQGNQETIECIRQRLKTLKEEHRARSIRWSVECIIINNNLPSHKYLKEFRIDRTSSAPPGTSSPPQPLRPVSIFTKMMKFTSSINW